MKISDAFKGLFGSQQVTTFAGSRGELSKARLYEYSQHFFVCSVRWIAETDSVTVIPQTCDDKAIGDAISRHLDEFDASEFDLSGRKRSDWAAFRASDAKSIKAFEAGLWSVDLGSWGSEVTVTAWPRSAIDKPVKPVILKSETDDPASIGMALRSALERAKSLSVIGSSH